MNCRSLTGRNIRTIVLFVIISAAMAWCQVLAQGSGPTTTDDCGQTTDIKLRRLFNTLMRRQKLSCQPETKARENYRTTNARIHKDR